MTMVIFLGIWLEMCPNMRYNEQANSLLPLFRERKG